MSLLEDLFQVLWFKRFGDKTKLFSDSNIQNLSRSMSNAVCGSRNEEHAGCRDASYALTLKLIAIGLILTFGVCGVAIPLIGMKRRFLRTDSNLFIIAKAFAAGVILATGFVHMLSDATSALSDPCLPEFPWSKFPFPGFIAMLASLATLLADFLGTQYYERKQQRQQNQAASRVDSTEVLPDSGGIVPADVRGVNEKLFGAEEGGAMHIVGMHAHAAHHRHSHSQEDGACAGHARVGATDSHGHLHSHSIGPLDEEGGVRHIVVSQVLELGIVSHSVIIGLSLGVSQSPCVVRPLIGALSVHQFFEGFALGGCISQALLRTLHSTVMACFFALTTPVGIAVGIGLSRVYNANSPRALVIEGIFDSVSAGILVYMALVDLIAADFLSKRMSCNLRLQIVSYFALFLGAVLMSSLAIWA